MTEREKLIEKVARSMCDEWGFLWDGDPDDYQVIAEESEPYDDRPNKQTFRKASSRIVDAIFEELKEPNDKMRLSVSKNWGRRTWAEYQDVLNASPLAPEGNINNDND